MEENRTILTQEECENISGGSQNQWNEVEEYIKKYIRTHHPEAVRDPENIRQSEIVKFMHFNLPDYNGAAVPETEERENDYFFFSGKILSHAEFMAFLRETLPM